MRKPKSKDTFINKVNFKTLIPITLVSVSFSIVSKVFFVSDKSNKNNVQIGDTGESSNLNISQSNVQNTNTDYGQIVFIVFLIIAVIGILLISYKVYKANNEK